MLQSNPTWDQCEIKQQVYNNDNNDQYDKIWWFWFVSATTNSADVSYYARLMITHTLIYHTHYILSNTKKLPKWQLCAKKNLTYNNEKLSGNIHLITNVPKLVKPINKLMIFVNTPGKTGWKRGAELQACGLFQVTRRRRRTQERRLGRNLKKNNNKKL